jgi:GAF domain-containing protein
MLVDADALARTITRLGETEIGDTGVEVALQQVIDAAQALFPVSGAGLMFLDDDHTLRYVAASDEAGRVLEVAQEEHGVGPCVDSLINDVVTRVADVRAVREYAPVAAMCEPLGVIAVLGVPVHVAQTAVGSLNVYMNERREWDDADVEALQAFSGLIERVLAAAALTDRHSSVIEQLEFALEHRVVTERAVGALMAHQRVDAVTAFNLLRANARGQRRKVSEVAAQVVADVARGLPPLGATGSTP